MKLSVKVSLVVGGLVLFFMVGLAYASFFIASEIMQGTAKKSLQNQSAIAAQLIDRSIVRAELSVLYELANRARTQTLVWETQRDSLLPEIDRHGYLDFGIVGPDGIAHYMKEDTTSNLSDRDYIIKALAGESVISDVLVSRVTNRPVVMFAVPIMVGGRAAQVLIGRRDGAVLTDMTKQIGMGDTGYVYMINSQGIFVCHPDTSLVYTQFNPITAARTDRSMGPLASFIEDVLAGKNEVEEYAFDGKIHIAAYAKVPNTGWYLIGSVEKNELFSGINQMLLQTLLLAGAAAVVAVFILILVLSATLIKPIRGVVEAAISLANLKFDIDIPRDRKDEIGDVQRAFWTIRDELQKTIAGINNEHMGQKN
ncbi:MAG: Cache 3/Cache 2 fusion domain-containing protein, partial [Spirochaetales bacterium]|nr:Cache 3/Cache 2 fusion domain-containing protein [Spirochaetales bacterium]